MLEVIDLSCKRAEHSLFRPVSFVLPAGRALLLKGANGAGKTTLLLAVMGLHEQYCGQINILQPCIFIGHQHLLHPDLTVRQNLNFLQAQTLTQDLFNIKLLLETPCRNLSAGQKQRVSLSRLLAASAPLWVLDEPLANLDSNAEDLFIGACKSHMRNGGAILMATHDELDLGTTLCLN